MDQKHAGKDLGSTSQQLWRNTKTQKQTSLAHQLLNYHPMSYAHFMHWTIVLELWLWLGLGLPSCLYIGGLNHPPEGSIVSEESTNALHLEKGGSITLEAKVFDPDSDDLSFSWGVHVLSAEDGETYTLNHLEGSLEHPNYEKGSSPRTIATWSTLALQWLPLRGRYTVTLRAADSFGAEVRLTYPFEVPNQVPAIKAIRIERDPDAKGDRVPDVNGSFPARAHYLAWINHDEVDDAEGDLQCSGPGSIKWELLSPKPSALDYWQVLSCKEQELKNSKLRFRLSASLASRPPKLMIRAIAEDGLGGRATKEVSMNLTPDRPPCMEMTTPAAAEQGEQQQPLKAVVLSEMERQFDAGPVSDDVREGLTFTWLVKDKGNSAFIRQPDQTGSTFKLRPYFRPPGEVIYLRVMVQDFPNDLPSCDNQQAFCRQATGLPDHCYQWITWEVEFR